MALGKVGLAQTPTGANATTRTSPAMSAAVPVGSTVIIDVGMDNTGAAGAKPASLSVADTKGNIYVLLEEQNTVGGGASGGTYLARFWCPTTTVALTTSDTVTATTGVSAAIGIVVSQITCAAGAAVEHIATQKAPATAALTVSVASLSTVAIGDLVLGAAAVERAVAPTGDSDTTGGSWTARATGFGGNSGSAPQNVNTSIQSKVCTAAGTQTFNPTWTTATDASAILSQFREVPAGEIELVQYNKYEVFGNAVITLPSVTAGNLILVALAEVDVNNSPPVFSISDTAGNTYTGLTQRNATGWDNSLGCRFYWAIANATGDITITAPLVNGWITMVAMEYANVDSASPFAEAESGTNGSTATTIPGAPITGTLAAGNIVVAMVAPAGSTAVSVSPSGLMHQIVEVESPSTNQWINVQKYRAPGGGTFSTAWTFGTASRYVSSRVVLAKSVPVTNIALAPATVNLVEPGLGITQGAPAGTSIALSPATVNLAAQSVGITAPPPATGGPTFVAEYSYNFATVGTSARNVGSVAVQAGDLILVYGMTESTVNTLSTPSDGVNTYTARENVGNSSECHMYLWSAIAATTTSLTIASNISTSTEMGGLQVEVWRNHGGLGVTGANAINSSGSLLTLTSTVANSAMSMLAGDWSAGDGTSRTRRTVNGSTGTEELYERRSADATVYGARWDNVGTAGAKTIGYSAPSAGTIMTTVGAEILAPTNQSVALAPATVNVSAQAQTLSASSTGNITLVKSGKSVLFGNGVVTLTGVAAGNLILVSVSEYDLNNTPPAFSVSDSASNAYNALPQQSASFSGGMGIRMFYAIANATGNVTITAPLPNGWITMIASEWSGVNTASPISIAASGTNGTPATASPVAAASGVIAIGDVVVGLLYPETNVATITETAGWSLVQEEQGSGTAGVTSSLIYRKAVATTSLTPGWTLSATSQYVATRIALNASTATPSPQSIALAPAIVAVEARSVLEKTNAAGPTIKSVGSAVTYDSSGNPRIQIPATASTGDLMVAAISTLTTTDLATPAGWTKQVGSSSALAVYTKVLGAGEAGNFVSFVATPWAKALTLTSGVTRGPVAGVTAPGGATVVNPGDDIGAKVEIAKLTGTKTIFFNAGTYSNVKKALNSTHNGMTFIGAFGAILDGTNTTDFGLYGDASNITIKNLEFKNYVPALQLCGPINPYDPGGSGTSNWITEDCSIHDISHCGINMVNGSVVRRCKIYNIGQTGIQSGNADVTDLLIEDNEIYNVNIGEPNDKFWHAGGIKLTEAVRPIIRRNYIHDCEAGAIWIDINCHEGVIVDNYCATIDYYGIFYEISWGPALIARNVVQGATTGYGGIYVSNSVGVTVEQNLVRNSDRGIVSQETDRFDQSPDNGYPTFILNDMLIRNNRIETITGLQGTIWWTPTTPLTPDNRSLSFVENSYDEVLGTHWDYDGAKTFTQWQALGFDAAPKLVPASGSIYNISGQHATPIDAVGTLSTLASGTSATTPVLTTANGNSLVLSFVGSADGLKPQFSVSGTGWSEATDMYDTISAHASAVEYRASAGAVPAATFTSTVTSQLQATSIAVRSSVTSTSIALSPATVNLVEPGFTVTPGTVSLPLGFSAIAVSAQAQTRVVGTTSLPLVFATIVVGAQVQVRTAGAVNLALTQANIAVGAQAQVSTPGTTSLALTQANIAVGAQAQVRTAAATLPLTQANVVVGAQAQILTAAASLSLTQAVIVVGAQAQVRTTGTASVAMSPGIVNVQALPNSASNAVSLVLAPATVNLVEPPLAVTAGPVSVPLTQANIAVQGQPVTPSNAVTLALSPATIVVGAQAQVRTAGAISLALTQANIAVQGQAAVGTAAISLAMTQAIVAVQPQAVTPTGATSVALTQAVIVVGAQPQVSAPGTASVPVAPTIVNVQALPASAGNSVSLVLAPATINLVEPPLAVTSGLVSLTLTQAVIAVQAQPQIRTGAISLALTQAVINTSAQAPGLTVGTASVPLTQAIIVVGAQPQVRSADRSLALTQAIITTASQSVGLTTGAATPALTPAVVSVGAMSMQLGGTLTVGLSPATVSVVPQAQIGSAGQVSLVTGSSGVLLTPQAMSVNAATAITAGVVSVVVGAQSVTRAASANLALTQAIISTAAQAQGITPGASATAMSPGIIQVTPMPQSVQGSGTNLVTGFTSVAVQAQSFTTTPGGVLVPASFAAIVVGAQPPVRTGQTNLALSQASIAVQAQAEILSAGLVSLALTQANVTVQAQPQTIQLVGGGAQNITLTPGEILVFPATPQLGSGLLLPLGFSTVNVSAQPQARIAGTASIQSLPASVNVNGMSLDRTMGGVQVPAGFGVVQTSGQPLTVTASLNTPLTPASIVVSARPGVLSTATLLAIQPSLINILARSVVTTTGGVTKAITPAVIFINGVAFTVATVGAQVVLHPIEAPLNVEVYEDMFYIDRYKAAQLFYDSIPVELTDEV